MLRIHLPFTCLLVPCCLFILSCQSKDEAEDIDQDADDTSQTTDDKPQTIFQSAIDKVDSQCPPDYPDTVTPLPESKDFEEIDTASLMKMLESWNPSLRAQAATALSERGKEVLDVLKQGSTSDNWMVRAGTTTALAAIIKQSLTGLTAEQQEAVKQEHADIISEFVRLTSDERLEVRVAALGGLSTVAPQTPAAAKAVLNLCDDPDDYLAQDAMIILEKQFSIDSLEQDEVVAAFKAALGRSLPRGKGHIVRIITRMKPETQSKFVPDLLAHLDWKPMRDTMFGSGGQEDSIKLLTKMKETKLIERLPNLMGKFDRGAGLFDSCLNSAKAFGKDAKIILPELKAILADIEANGKNAKIAPNRDIEAGAKELKKTIEYLESL